jgi:uncharacterized protein involved in exopolysaccharide biosynthesis
VSQAGAKLRPDYSTEAGFREARRSPELAGAGSARVFERLRLLWEARRVVARATICGLAVGTLVAFLLPKQYKSTMQLMPPDTQSNSGAMLAALSAKAGSGIGAMAGDLLGGNSTGVLFVGMLRSRTLEDRLVARFDLKKVYHTRVEEDARTTLANNTGVSDDHRSGIITVTVMDHDPARAAALAQAYAEELERLVSELSTSSARRERVFLEDRLKVVKQELDQASAEFSQFASRNTAINIPEQGKAMVEAAALLQGQLIAAESQLKGLAEIYTDNNIRVRSLEARVAELRRQLENLDGDSPASKPGSARTEPSPYPTLRQLPLLGVTYADLLRRTKIEETVYETLTQQYELAKVEEAKETPSVKILDAASVPEKKSFPPRLSIMFMSSCFGVAAGVAWVLARDRWRQAEPDDPARALAYEIFHTVNAHMPWAPPNGSRLQAITHQAWMRFGSRGQRD